MAGFKTHIATSTLVGLGYGAGAYTLYGVPAPSCILAGGLCAVAGMLPDLDSGEARPLRESLSFAAAVIATMLVDRFQRLGLAMETIVLAAAGVYGLVRFGLAELLKRYTVHRGMFHSLPAAVIFAEIAFLLSSGGVPLRAYKAGAVGLGYLTHLVLDELFSLHYVRGRMAAKRSFWHGPEALYHAPVVAQRIHLRQAGRADLSGAQRARMDGSGVPGTLAGSSPAAGGRMATNGQFDGCRPERAKPRARAAAGLRCHAGSGTGRAPSADGPEALGPLLEFMHRDRNLLGTGRPARGYPKST